MAVLTDEYLNYNPKLPRTLYHYCSIDAFLSIIQNKCIWLSDADKTNDSSELNYIFEFFKETINEILKNYGDKYDNNLKNTVKDIAYSTVYKLVYKKAPISQYRKSFLCCFSESKDLLSQWRAYGNDGKGIAIGFDSKMLASIVCDETYNFTKVIYKEKVMKDFLYKALTDPLQWAIDSSIDEKNNNLISQDELFLQVSMIICAIWREGFVFKHSGFSEEKEWRIYKYTASSNYHFDEGVDDYGYAGFIDGIFSKNEQYMGEYSRSELKYRSTPNDIRLYFEIGFDKCKDKLLKQIILGPKCDIDILDLKLLLTQNNYIDNVQSKKIKIEKAKCPYI